MLVTGVVSVNSCCQWETASKLIFMEPLEQSGVGSLVGDLELKSASPNAAPGSLSSSNLSAAK